VRDAPITPGIHSTASVDPRAELGAAVFIGPGACVGAGVVLGDGCVVGANAVLEGPAVFGSGNVIGPMAHLGGDPQDLKYQGTDTRLEVGEGNDFRSFCTVNRGTEHGGGVTRVGNGCLLMHYSHVAHDNVIEDGVVLANSANLGGHVHLEEGAIIAALVGIHQFVRVGRLAMVAAGSMVSKDVLPFTLVQGDRARMHGTNTIGLKRAGVPAASRTELKAAIRSLTRPGGVLADKVAALDGKRGDPYIDELLAFLDRSTRGFCTP
jgi:UDP-N-acetylglucosamine acyltransferase